MRTWTARMIGPDRELDSAPLLRTEVRLDAGHGEVVEAVLDATARGVFTAHLGGRPVADDVLSPGWSSYEWRLRYRTYEVTAAVRGLGADPLVLGIALGNGWYRGRLGWTGQRGLYGDELGALAEL